MNIKEIKNIIDEIIYESIIGKNPFKVGDLVKLRPDVVGRFGKSKPAHAGFSRTEQAWMKTLENLIDKPGKVEKVFSDSKHINVKYPQSWTSKDEYDRPYTVNSIGIDYTELIPADKPEAQMTEVNYTTDKSTEKPTMAIGAPGSIARFTVENPHIIKAAREWVKDCQWRDVCEPDDVDDMSDIEIYQGVNKHYEGGINQFIIDSEPHQASEGFGAVYDKDRAKDPKSIKTPGGGTEHWRIKYQSTSDLKKHGSTEKSPVNEELSPKTIKSIEKLIVDKGLRPAANKLVNIFISNVLGGLTSDDLADTSIFADGLDMIEDALGKGDFEGAISIARDTAKEMIEDEGGEGLMNENLITVKDVKGIIQELIREMWVGWEEEEEGKVDEVENITTNIADKLKKKE